MEDDKNNETRSEALTDKGREAQKDQRKYFLHSTSRGRNNRTLRVQQGTPGRTQQFIGGGLFRIVRGRPAILSARQIGQHFKEIVEKCRIGAIEIRLADGRVVDPMTGEPVVPGKPMAPLPNFPLDSIRNDQQNVGERMPLYPGGALEGEDSDVPELVSKANRPDEDEVHAPPPVYETLLHENIPPGQEETPELLGGDGTHTPPDGPLPPEFPASSVESPVGGHEQNNGETLETSEENHEGESHEGSTEGTSEGHQGKAKKHKKGNHK